MRAGGSAREPQGPSHVPALRDPVWTRKKRTEPSSRLPYQAGLMATPAMFGPDLHSPPRVRRRAIGPADPVRPSSRVGALFVRAHVALPRNLAQRQPNRTTPHPANARRPGVSCTTARTARGHTQTSERKPRHIARDSARSPPSRPVRLCPGPHLPSRCRLASLPHTSSGVLAHKYGHFMPSREQYGPNCALPACSRVHIVFPTIPFPRHVSAPCLGLGPNKYYVIYAGFSTARCPPCSGQASLTQTVMSGRQGGKLKPLKVRRRFRYSRAVV